MKSEQAWNERALQDAVYIHCAIKRHEIIVPNSCLFDWESDLVSVTRADYIHEYEIKVTRADFKADAKKKRARILVDAVERIPLWGGVERERVHRRPNYFWYVVPAGLITVEEVPEYAGLMYVSRRVDSPLLYRDISRDVKPAKQLHKDKINGWQRAQLTRALNTRYWHQRLSKLGAVDQLPAEECVEIEALPVG